MGGRLSAVRKQVLKQKKPGSKDKRATKFSSVKKRTLIQRAGDKIMNQDLFAEDIKLNFKGRQTFTSKAGALLSIMLKTTIFVFFITRMLSVVSMQAEKNNEAVEKIEWLEFQEDINFESHNYNVMMGFNVKLPPEIGEISYYLEEYESGSLLVSTKISSGICSSDLEGVAVIERELRGEQGDSFEFFCPKNLEGITLKANHFQRKSTQLSGYFTRCIDSDFLKCEGEEPFQKFVDSANLLLFVPENHI